MYRKHLEKQDNSLALAKLFTTVSDHSVEITDFRSTVENVGYGKNLFFNLLKTINLMNRSYRINAITGYLSPVDYSEWDKLARFYSNMPYYIVQGVDKLICWVEE